MVFTRFCQKKSNFFCKIKIFQKWQNSKMIYVSKSVTAKFFSTSLIRCHDRQHNDTQNNDLLHNGTQHNNTLLCFRFLFMILDSSAEPMFINRQVSYSALFTFLVLWHIRVVGLPHGHLRIQTAKGHLVCFISTVNGRSNKKRKEKKKLTLGRLALVAGT